jgi:hypothetical protein
MHDEIFQLMGVHYDAELHNRLFISKSLILMRSTKELTISETQMNRTFRS